MKDSLPISDGHVICSWNGRAASFDGSFFSSSERLAELFYFSCFVFIIESPFSLSLVSSFFVTINSILPVNIAGIWLVRGFLTRFIEFSQFRPAGCAAEWFSTQTGLLSLSLSFPPVSHLLPFQSSLQTVNMAGDFFFHLAVFLHGVPLQLALLWYLQKK